MPTARLRERQCFKSLQPMGFFRVDAEWVGLGVQNASDFLRSKAIKRLLGESYTPQPIEG